VLRLSKEILMNLSGKVAIVTGGGRGLGLAYAQALASADAMAKAWPSSFADHEQKVGQQFPEPPQ
jgi:NAD(P)-dependent dehydrogenase (short-subunit alcohol dehydrogenase family)